MTHEQKIKYMRIAASIVGYNFDLKGLDMFISLYELVLEKQGQTDINSISDVEQLVIERDKERNMAKPIRPGRGETQTL